MSDAPDRRWYVLVFLRGNADPACVPQVSREAATASVLYVASTWLKFPPEARPASCWIIAHSGVVTRVDEAGVANVPQVEPLAVFDPREVVGVQVGSHAVAEPWKESA